MTVLLAVHSRHGHKTLGFIVKLFYVLEKGFTCFRILEHDGIVEDIALKRAGKDRCCSGSFLLRTGTQIPLVIQTDDLPAS